MADCSWTIKGVVNDQTGQPIKGKVVRVWTQTATGNASDPKITGPRETNWTEGTTNDKGGFTVTTSKPLPPASCTSSRVVGGTIGTNRVDLGDYGPFKGPAAAGPHSVDMGAFSIGVSASEVR
jgi:hypothetical protein